MGHKKKGTGTDLKRSCSASAQDMTWLLTIESPAGGDFTFLSRHGWVGMGTNWKYNGHGTYEQVLEFLRNIFVQMNLQVNYRYQLYKQAPNGQWEHPPMIIDV